MSKYVKLPDCLKSWKINSCVSDEKGNALYKVSRKEYDGSVVNANLRYISITNESYTSENIDFINNEITFLKSICQSGDYCNYIDIAVNNNPAKEKIELFLVTDELPTLAEIISKKPLDEAEIIDFGIQISEILEKLEANNIFHGNINLENIYMTDDGKYRLGGFSDFESQIEDMSFIAPEIKRNENADFTTDIYSLGLILYYLCNNQTLPFMSNSISKEEAIATRFEGKAINAPANGSEKLKSVIVIACQPDNANRWKNASNIKNALTSIKSEIPATVKPEVIVPETTDFSGNVFEEFDYEEFVETPSNENTVSENQPTEVPDTSSEDFENVEEVADIEESIEINTEIDSEEYITESDDVEEIDNRVFDDYETKGKVINFRQNVSDKDYGDYFDDETVEEFTEVANAVSSNNNDDVINYDVDSFEDNFDEDNTEETENNKNNKLIIVICILIMLAALGTVGFFIFNSVFANNNSKSNTETTNQAVETTIDTTETTTQLTTTQPITTVPETTIEPTTVPSENTNVIPVVGYGYSYAKKLLEKEGFVVEIGEYEYSEYYDAGYVIAQTPDGDTEVKRGSVVTLDISLGLIEEEETTQPATEPTTKPQATDSSYLFSNSDSAYLSQADLAALDRTNLNLALNEIYARKGRIFKDPSLSAYFSSKTWYTPKYTSNEFSANVTFNKYEEANLQLMVNEQKSRGYR